MKTAASTEAQDTAAKELNTDEGSNGKKVTNGSGPEPSAAAAPTPAASSKRRTASEKADAKKKAPPPDKAEDGGKPAARKKPAEKAALVADNGAGASRSDSASSPPAAAAAAGDAPAETPRRRRGILPVSRPDAATPSTADETGSLSWMAAQAVKALNAVKASQHEQAQEWKARLELSGSEQGGVPGEDNFDAGVDWESGPMPGADGLPSDATAAMPVPAVGRGAAARGAPLGAILILGTLAVIGLLGYRHWFAGEDAASDASAPTSALIGPAGPAAGVDMTVPPISVVVAPAPAAGGVEPPSAAASTSPSPEPAAATPASATLEIKEPATPAQTPGETATAGTSPAENPPTASPPAENPPAAARPEESPPAAAPAAPAVPAAPATAIARQPAPAPRPQYPATGYGYYAPPSSWQPYYRPAYPQAPAR